MNQPRTIYFILLFLLLPLSSLLYAQVPPQDMKVSIEPPPGDNIPQYWPGVFVQDGQIYVVWGESRVVDPNSFPEVWYTLARWMPNGSPAVEIAAAVKSDSIVPPKDSAIRRVSIGRSERPVPFESGYLVGSENYRGDITPAPTDTIYRSLFEFYFAKGGEWDHVTIDSRQRSKRDVFVNQRGYAYDPNRREVLCAWTLGSSRTGAEPTGTVTAVNMDGQVTWAVEGIPLAAQKVNLIPVREREFLTIIDSIAVRYVDGVRADSFAISSPYRPNALYQRLLDDVFIRGYLVADSSHHVLEMYGTDGTLQRTYDMSGMQVGASYYVAQEETTKVLGLVTTGPEGVFATILGTDFSEIAAKIRLSQGLDSASSPIAAFRDDTLFAAWQDTRNGEFDIYAVAYQYKEKDFGVDDGAAFARRLGIGAIFPNPANHIARVPLTLPYSSTVDLDLVDASGNVVRREKGIALAEGDREVPVSLDGLAPGSYTVVVYAGAMQATGKLILVR